MTDEPDKIFQVIADKLDKMGSAGKEREDSYRIAQSMGQLQGVQQGLIDGLRKIQTDIDGIRADFNAKHSENKADSNLKHAENTQLIRQHMVDDDKRFAEATSKIAAIDKKVGVIWVLGIIFLALSQVVVQWWFNKSPGDGLQIIRETTREERVIKEDPRREKQQ